MKYVWMVFLVVATTLLGASLTLDIGGYLSDSTIKFMLYVALFSALIRTFYLARILENNGIDF